MYELNWFGKLEAIENTYKPTNKKLIEDKESSKNWNNTENLYIEGDNLDVLKLLQKDYFGKIKMIYIDPPYNTGNDFIYKDNFRNNITNYKEVTNQTTKANAETSGRYHTGWLNMMYPRLKLARNLLREDGVMFISIDDNEVNNLKKICDEIFGENGYVATIPWRKRVSKTDVPFNLSQDYEWILVYAKSEFMAGREIERKYHVSDDFPNDSWRLNPMTTQRNKSERPNSYFTIVNPKNGAEYKANPNRVWAVTKDTFSKYYNENKIVFPGDYDFLNISQPMLRVFKSEEIKKKGDKFNLTSVSTVLPSDIGMTSDGTKQILELFGSKAFPFPKPYNLIKYLMEIIYDKEAIILDFFGGSSTTAHATMKLNSEDGGNRRFILVQLPEETDEKSEAYKSGYKNICEIGKERIRRAGKKIVEENKDKEGIENLDIGFKVFKLEEDNMLNLFDNNSKIDIEIEWIIKPKEKEVISKFKIDRVLYYLAKENDKYIIYSNNSKKKEKSKVYVLASIFYVESDVDYLQLEKEYVDKLVEFNQGWYHSDYVTCRILDEVYKNINK